MKNPFFGSPVDAASAGSCSKFFRVLAVSVDRDVAAVAVQENDDSNPVYALTICANTPRGWEVISESGGSATEVSLWALPATLDDQAPEGSLGIGAYVKRLDDRATHAKVALAQIVKTVPTSAGWILLVHGAIAEEDWNPRTVEIEINGRWLPTVET